MRYEGGQYFVKSEEEMKNLFPYALEALENTQKIADRCHVEIEFGVTKLPKYDVPDGYTSWEYLQKLCHDGLVRCYGEETKGLKERLDYDLLLVNIVDRTNAAVIIDKATQADIPVVFFNREPVREDIFRSDQIYYEGSDAKQSAILQADVIADALEKKRSKIDRNGDGVIQFAMLEGESGHQDTLIRSEWVLKELENKKIPTQQIAGSTGNWEKNQANVIVRQWMKEYPNQIEVIISNNDDMALGAWEALEEKGCTEVQVVGIDGIEEVRELVDEDKILGSVLCDTKLHAKALMQFIDVLAFHNGSVEKLNLENERYYMIPLTKVEK